MAKSEKASGTGGGLLVVMNYKKNQTTAFIGKHYKPLFVGIE